MGEVLIGLLPQGLTPVLFFGSHKAGISCVSSRAGRRRRILQIGSSSVKVCQCLLSKSSVLQANQSGCEVCAVVAAKSYGWGLQVLTTRKSPGLPLATLADSSKHYLRAAASAADAES